MGRKWLVLALLGTLLFLGAGVARADSGTLRLTGQAVVEQGEAQQRLLISADASDGSGWRLDLTSVPQRVRRRIGDALTKSSLPADQIVLEGTYQLSGPGIAMISGRAIGQVSREGDGQFQLLDSAGNRSLSATFTVHDSGQVDLDLIGPLPSPPPATADSGQPVNHTFWYVARAAGFTAYALLTLTVCLGLLVSTHVLDALVARWRSFDLHQFTALLALSFLALHIFSLLGDQYVGFQLDQLFIPLISPYRPFEVALGVIAMYLFVVVVGSFYVRRSISYQTWRAIHYVTFGVFLLALAHGVLAGTDTGEPWARGIYVGTGLLVAALTLFRRIQATRPQKVARPVRGQSVEGAGVSR